MFAAGWFAEEREIPVKKYHEIDKGLFKQKYRVHMKQDVSGEWEK